MIKVNYLCPTSKEIYLRGTYYSIFIFQHCILHDDFMMTSGCLQDDSKSRKQKFREHSDNTQKALRKHLKSTQKSREQFRFVRICFWYRKFIKLSKILNIP